MLVTHTLTLRHMSILHLYRFRPLTFARIIIPLLSYGVTHTAVAVLTRATQLRALSLQRPVVTHLVFFFSLFIYHCRRCYSAGLVVCRVSSWSALLRIENINNMLIAPRHRYILFFYYLPSRPRLIATNTWAQTDAGTYDTC